MKDLGNLNEMELDAIKELGNIGVGKAATSISNMLGKEIDMSVPQAKIVAISKLHEYIDSEFPVAAVVTALEDLEKGNSGFLFVAFPNDTPEKICSVFLDEVTEDMVESSVMEIGNIISSSFCDAIAEFLNTVLIPSPPNYARDFAIAILQVIIAQLAEKSDYLIVFEAEMSDRDDAIEILIILVPNEKFMGYIAEMLNMVG